MRQLLQLGLELRLWVAVCVTTLSLFCEQILFGTAADASTVHIGSSARIVMAATLALYNLDGTLDCLPLEPSKRQRRRAHLTLTIIASLWLQIELIQVGTWLMLPILFGFLACSSYAFRLVVLGRSIQLKAVPGLKSPFIGSAVGTAVVLVPLLCAAKQRPWLSAAVLAASLCCLCTANAQLFDFPDYLSDQSNGIRTTPLALGENISRLICIGWISLGVMFGAFTASPARYPLFALGCALLVATGLTKTTTPKSKVAFFVDGALCLPLFVRTIMA